MSLTKKQLDKVLVALDGLDQLNADHWTEDGLPSVSIVAELSGISGVTAEDIASLAPDLKRVAAPADDTNAGGADNGGGSAGDNAGTNPDQNAGGADNGADKPEVGSGENSDPNAAPIPPVDGDGGAQLQDREPTDLEKLQFALSEANEDLDDAMAHHQRASQTLAEAQNRVAAIQSRINRVHVHEGHSESAHSIRGYLDSQQRLREDTAKRIQEAGGQPGRAQIDRSFARRTGYGGQRPNVLLTK